MTKNIIDKIWESHVVHSKKDTPDILFIDLQLIHEVTSPQAFDVLREKNLLFFDTARNIATLDHSIPSDPDRKDYPDDRAKKQVETLRKNCKDFGIQLFDTGSGNQGIVHVIAPELGLTQPGLTIVCGDSHTATHGAFGALAFGIGTTQISHVMATQCLLLEKPKTMKVMFIGTPSKYFSAKDAILTLINKIGIEGGTGHAIEYCGEYIQNCTMEERMTICNMSIECGAKSGLISPDNVTFEYLKGRKYASENFEKKKSEWIDFASDQNATYDTVVEVDIEKMHPLVTWGTNPEQSVQITENIPDPDDCKDLAKKLSIENALKYTKLTPNTPIEGTKIDYVFIGSCTNGRIDDMRQAAEILKGIKVKEGVTVYIVPGSEAVQAQCEVEGLDKIFVQAGAQFRMPGCSMCLAMNGDLVPPKKRCASTSNRNFIGRQGLESITHLMSPLMAAICAVTGEITAPPISSKI